MSAPNGRVSMLAPAGTPQCSSCAYFKADARNFGGWCQHWLNRAYADGWPYGFTPSQARDGSCELHPARAAIAAATNGESA